jgi:hypothetical protein
LLIREFHHQLEELGGSWPEDVGVYGTTHIGGHKYAGTLIVYPEGHWYGRLRTCDVPVLIQEQLVKGHPVKKYWRGHMQGEFKEQPADPVLDNLEEPAAGS